jgi:hypothetical protein
MDCAKAEKGVAKSWGSPSLIKAVQKTRRATKDETKGIPESLQMEPEKGLYVGTGFPQLVQGKPGEN